MPQSEIDDLEAELAGAKERLRDELSAKFPKWVAVHKTQVYQGPDGLPKTAWPETHQDRDGNVTVLVQNEDEEGQAGEAVVPVPAPLASDLALPDPPNVSATATNEEPSQ